MAVKNYDPKNIILTVGTQALGGFADGTYVEMEFDDDFFKKKVGVDGEVTRIKTNNFCGQFRFSLDQASPSNDHLSTLMLLDKASNAGVVPVSMVDKNGTTKVVSASAWVKKSPNASFSGDSENREWVIDCGQTEAFIGGHNT